MMNKRLLIFTLILSAAVLFCVIGFSVETLAAAATIPVVGAALTADRDTPFRSGNSLRLGVATTKKIFAGSLVAVDANGYATPGATSATIRGVGRAEEYVDNSGGANGAVTVQIAKGVFRFANSAAGDQITAADIGNDCYIVDDQTVAKTNGTNTRSVAGRIFDVDSDGVWVKFF